MKKITFKPQFFLILTFLFSVLATNAQVGIGNTNPAESSLLDIKDTNANKGILIPRVSIENLTTQAPITGAMEESLLVYNTNSTTGEGFYYWDNTKWNKLSTNGDTNDWYKEGTTTKPNDIDDNMYTNGEIGIGTDTPVASLHISEPNNGTQASATDGTILLEHDNAGGQSSIVFKSRVNNNNDYGYINFSDDGAGSGSTDENALLTIGIENDVPGQYQDDINIAPSGELMVSIGDPAITDYSFRDNAFEPATNGVKDLGSLNTHWDDLYIADDIVNTRDNEIDIKIGANTDYRFSNSSFQSLTNGARDLGVEGIHWRNLFINGQIRNSEGGTIDITLNTIPDFSFTEEAFIPLPQNNGPFTKDLGSSGNRWRTVYAQNALNTSDRRLKKNISDLTLGMNKVSKIKTHTYTFKSLSLIHI